MMTMKFGFAIVYTKTSKCMQLEGLLCSVLFPHFMYCVCNYYCTQNVRKYQCTCIANYTEENVIWQLQGCPVAGNTCIMLQIGNDIQLLFIMHVQIIYPPESEWSFLACMYTKLLSHVADVYYVLHTCVVNRKQP